VTGSSVAPASARASGAGGRAVDLPIPAMDVTLAATLTLPSSLEAGPIPAVLLLPGSGPVDRDSNVRSMRLDVTRHLAEALAARGVASLRYDKRGVGASGGGDWRAVGFWDLVRDAQDALAVLAARPEIDAARLVVLGHSEGALLATHLAAHDDRVSAAVLVGASAKPGDQVLAWQASNVARTLPAPVRAILRLLRVDLVARVVKNHERLKKTTTDVVRFGFVRTNARWFREFMAYDPRADLRDITVPVLAITGAKDIQVDPHDLAVIADLVPGPVTIECPADVTHILRTQAGTASLRQYRSELKRPVDAVVTATIVQWVSASMAAADPSNEQPVA
jgi:pimeloyl-ACP methyl ester carboxylesterase